ncbi:unnamed protein product [Ranitomeya imitator]|uniref:Uncharacterized protein n=1 Tax=Ranitomeya imitator TaxID=111125 RepID=A0ABN9L0C1_9NEOB|nr:unnamed protein product [Ranitomeya imitator]
MAATSQDRGSEDVPAFAKVQNSIRLHVQENFRVQKDYQYVMCEILLDLFKRSGGHIKMTHADASTYNACPCVPNVKDRKRLITSFSIAPNPTEHLYPKAMDPQDCNCSTADAFFRSIRCPIGLLVPAENPANVRTANVQHAKKAAAPAVRLSAVSAARAVSAAMDVTPAAAASDRRYTRTHRGACDIYSMATVIRAPVIAICAVYV